MGMRITTITGLEYDERKHLGVSWDETSLDGVSSDEVIDDAHETLMALRHERLSWLLDRLPPIEADLLLGHLRGSRQVDLSGIFGITQAGVSYRLSRAIARLQFFAKHYEVLTKDDISYLDDLAFLGEEDARACLALRWRDQTHGAEVMGWSQGKMRHHLLGAAKRCIARAQIDPRIVPYAQFFEDIGDGNWNIMHDVVLPQWIKKTSDIR